MGNAALVNVNNLVDWRIVLRPGVTYNPPEDLDLVVETLETGPSSIGYTWTGTVFVPPPSNPDPPPTPEQVRAALFQVLPERQDLVQRLQTATPAQIDNWLSLNVTTLAQARTVLGALIKVLCVGPPS